MIDSTAVADIAIGGQVSLTSTGSGLVHGGYGTDRSPVGQQDTVFTRVDLRKITAGLSGRTSHFLGSVGVQYLGGESGSVLLRELPSGQLTTKFAVHSLGLMYSLTVMF